MVSDTRLDILCTWPICDVMTPFSHAVNTGNKIEVSTKVPVRGNGLLDVYFLPSAFMYDCNRITKAYLGE